jgi:hypothetical protein
MVVDLSNELEVPYCQSAEVIWASDSKRFAFDYTPPHAPHFTYQTTAFFELRGDKWVALPAIVDEASQTSQLIQLAKEHLPKNLRSKHGDLLRDVLKVRNWVDPNTAIVYAYSLWEGKASRDYHAALLFTLKVDAKGKWQVVKTESVPDKEIKE